MTTDLLPLRERPFQRHLIHVDDIGRAMDRARILLNSAREELLAAAHVAPECEGLAEELGHIKTRLVKAWNDLAEPELPLQ